MMTKDEIIDELVEIVIIFGDKSDAYELKARQFAVLSEDYSGRMGKSAAYSHAQTEVQTLLNRARRDIDSSKRLTPAPF